MKTFTFTVRLRLPLNSLIPCSLLTAWCDLPVSVLSCCKHILQICKTLCTQKFLYTGQIPFNNPSWDTMSWRPWSLLAFSENLDSLGNKPMYSRWVLSGVEGVMNIHHGFIYHQTLWNGCTEGQPWMKEKTQCQAAIQATHYHLSRLSRTVKLQKVRAPCVFITEDHALSKHRRIVWGGRWVWLHICRDTRFLIFKCARKHLLDLNHFGEDMILFI